MNLSAISLDCANPMALATFYHHATGAALHERANDECAAVAGPHGMWLVCLRVDDYRAPTWPDQNVPQQLHLDFDVDDLAEAEARLLELGAAKPEFQPGGRGYTVLTDPAGHPFCLVPRQNG